MQDKEEDLPKNINDKWKIISKIGDGSYGVIYQGENCLTKEKVAIKKFKEDNYGEGIAASTLIEIVSLKNLVHKNIITIYDVFFVKDVIYITQELMEKDLSAYISEMKTIPLITAKSILIQILRGVEFVHSNNYFHRDLKPQNILLKNTQKNILVKITDFGLCKNSHDEQKKCTKNSMTPLYRAPEVMVGSENYGMEVDLWSVGCIFAEMILGHPVFYGSESEIEIIKRLFDFYEINEANIGTIANDICFKDYLVSKDKWKKTYPTLDDDGLDLLEKLLTVNPKKRISATEAIQHKFFEGLQDE